MSLQLRFGIAGAALGLIIGILGCLIAAAPFPVLLWKTLLAIVMGGVLGFAVHAAIRVLLPELLQEEGGNPAADLGDGTGQSVNITLGEEGPVNDYTAEGDQAAPLRQAVRNAAEYDDDGVDDDAGAESDMIEEVSEDRRSHALGAEAGGEASFNEAAFYDGVEHLPDIGGFSEQFQAGDGEEGSEASGVEEPAMASGSSKSHNKNGPANIDPALVAQAIRTALKKEDR
jgi:hypothetical protein